MTRWVFIGGLQRSGTTLLGRLLSQHESIAGLVNTGRPNGEGQAIQQVYLNDHQMGQALGKNGKAVRWAYHPEAHLTEADVAGRPDALARLEASWEPFWDKPDAPARVEKSPSNVMKTRFLQEVFPDASFIMITRHPAMQALAVRKWAQKSARIGFGLDRIIDHWLTAMETFAADRPHLDRAMTCSYEELMTEPAALLERAQQFIGVQPQQLDTSSISERSTRYRDYWERMSGRAPGSRFVSTIPLRHPLSRLPRMAERVVVAANGRRAVRDITERYGDRIARFGYDFERVDSAGDWT